MSRESLVMVCGLCVAFLPSLGIPESWRTYAAVGLGVLLVLLGYSLRRSLYFRMTRRANGERGNDAFVEHDGSTPKIETEVSVDEPA